MTFSRPPGRDGRPEDRFEANAADKVWEVAEECLTAPGA